jgi:hypothetical protein
MKPRRGARNAALDPQRKLKGREMFHSRPCAISTKNKHLLLSCDTNPRFHGGSFGVYGHTSCKALKL